MAKKKSAVRTTRIKQLSEDESDLRKKYHEMELLVDRLSGYASEPRTSLCELEAMFDSYAESSNAQFNHMTRRDESVHTALSKVREVGAEQDRQITLLAARLGSVEKELGVEMLNSPTLRERMDSQTTVNAHFVTRIDALERPGFFRRLWRKVRG